MINMTLFGPATMEKTCNTCRKTKDLEDGFYIESQSKARHNEQRRDQCKECWKRFNGDVNYGRKILKREAMGYV